jgi:hypothetical protein
VNRLFLTTLLFSILLISGCSDEAKIVKTEGKSEYWNASVTYELKTEMHSGEKVNMLYDIGTVTYLDDNPPNEIYFEFVYPNGFPSGSSGFIEHFEEDKSEFRISGGGSSSNETDTFESLKEKIDETKILVKWKINNKAYEEYIQLNVIE